MWECGSRPRTVSWAFIDAPQDYDALYKAGAEAIFPPGTVIADAAEELIHKLNARLGHSEAAA